MNKKNSEQLMALLDSRSDQLKTYLPESTSVDQFKAGVMLAFVHNPSLHQCTAASKMQALLDCAYAGLDIAGKQPHGYLVPRGTTCCFDLSYHGYIHLGLRSGVIRACRVGTVREGDDVDYYRDEKGDHFVHRPNLLSEGAPTHYYALFTMADRSLLVSIMSHEQIERHRQQYAQTRGQQTPWVTSHEAMAHKTVIKQPFLRGMIQIRDEAARRIIDSDHILNSGVVETGPDDAVVEQIEQQGMTEAGLEPEFADEVRQQELAMELQQRLGD